MMPIKETAFLTLHLRFTSSIPITPWIEHHSGQICELHERYTGKISAGPGDLSIYVRKNRWSHLVFTCQVNRLPFHFVFIL